MPTNLEFLQEYRSRHETSSRRTVAVRVVRGGDGAVRSSRAPVRHDKEAMGRSAAWIRPRRLRVRPRWVILRDALAAFERWRTSEPTPKPMQRRRLPGVINFYSDL